jgi:hypothetical protein
MGNVVTNLLAGGIQGAGQGIAAVINAIKGKNPEDAAKLQELLTKHEDTILQVNADLEKAKMDENVKLNDIAGQNIRAEQASRYTAWARPSVIYAWIAVIIYNYIVTGLLNKAAIVMPEMFWEVSGVVVTGYVMARTGDKLFGGSGGSIKGLGLNIDSKGD